MLIGACVLIPLSVTTRSMSDRRKADRLAWIGLVAMGFFSTLFVLTLLRDVALIALRLATGGRYLVTWLAPSAVWVLALASLMTLSGLHIARRRPVSSKLKFLSAICPRLCAAFRSPR